MLQGDPWGDPFEKSEKEIAAELKQCIFDPIGQSQNAFERRQFVLKSHSHTAENLNKLKIDKSITT